MDQDSSMSFQKTVLVIAIIALILTLSVIGYMMYYSAQSKTYPPTYSTCPDMWGLTGSNICTNTVISGSFSNIGSFITDVSCSLTGSCSSMVGWNGATGMCDSRWVQGNSANGLDNKNCYLLASSVSNEGYSAPTTVQHTLVPSLGENVDWARKYDIAWDGLN
jgi:hypothetical protein